MSIILTFTEKEYCAEVYDNEFDPLTGGRGVGMVLSRRIASCLGIPLGGEAATVRAYSLNGKAFSPGQTFWLDNMNVRPGNSLPIPVQLWTESMKEKAEAMLPLAGSGWKYNWVALLIGLSLLLFLAWGSGSG